jgi:hypothetical protein
VSITQFRAALAASNAEPLRFSIAVPDGENGERDEVFEVARPVPAMPIIDLALRQANASTQAEALQLEASGTAAFIADALGAEDYQRFVRAATAARFGTADLVQVVRWLVEEDAGRPFVTSSPSSSSGSPSGATSSGGAKRKASRTRRASEASGD